MQEKTVSRMLARLCDSFKLVLLLSQSEFCMKIYTQVCIILVYVIYN